MKKLKFEDFRNISSYLIDDIPLEEDWKIYVKAVKASMMYQTILNCTDEGEESLRKRYSDFFNLNLSSKDDNDSLDALIEKLDGELKNKNIDTIPSLIKKINVVQDFNEGLYAINKEMSDRENETDRLKKEIVNLKEELNKKALLLNELIEAKNKLEKK